MHPLALQQNIHDFYPRSPCGERPSFAGLCKTNFPFLSTLSLRRATLAARDGLADAVFLSTLSLRRATHIRSTSHGRPDISIHALLAESDSPPYMVLAALGDFYPRSPCGERQASADCFSKTPLFLSTLSLRRATSYSQHVTWPSGYFYPRSPCGERR